MADVTRDEFTALTNRVTALEGKTPIPPVVPVVITGGVQVAAPTITVTDNRYTITAAIKAVAKPASFVFLQLAVRGPGAVDLAFNPSTRLKADESKTLTASSTGRAGTFTTYLAYSQDGKTWVNGPQATFTIAGTTNPDAGDGVPLAGRSGLGFNSIVFRQNPTDAEQFGKRRGVPVDGFLWFTSRGNWDQLHAGYDGFKDWLDAKRLVVTTMPHAPQSEGDQMNNRGANDGYRDQQRQLGSDLASKGLNSPFHAIRVDWECNGNWYPWSANRPGGADALKQALIHYITNLRAGGLTKVPFNLCFNKGPSQAGHDFDIFPGAEYVDVIGVDQYDMWMPAHSAGDWNNEMAKSPSIRLAAKFAREHGIQWSWDEGGNTHGDGGAYGGDNPDYWQFTYDEIQANLDNCAWHNTYDNGGAPATLRHDFDSNQASWNKYKQLWTPR